MSDVSLELEPIARPVPRTTSTLSEFAGDDTFHDMMDSERRKADMTSIHRPVDLMTFEEADKAEGLVVAGSREYDPSGHEAASGVSSTRQKMSDEAFAWKLWEEENKSIRREQRNASGRYHAEDELLARALQEEYDQEAQQMRRLAQQHHQIMQPSQPMPPHSINPIRIVYDRHRRQSPQSSPLLPAASTVQSHSSSSKERPHAEADLEHNHKREMLVAETSQVDSVTLPEDSLEILDTSNDSDILEATENSELIQSENGTPEDSGSEEISLDDIPDSLINQIRDEILPEMQLESQESLLVPERERPPSEMPEPPIPGQIPPHRAAMMMQHPLLQLLGAMQSPVSYEDLMDIEDRLGCLMRGADERMIDSTTFSTKFTPGSGGKENKYVVCFVLGVDACSRCLLQ
jgi:hypothetical protein